MSDKNVEKAYKDAIFFRCEKCGARVYGLDKCVCGRFLEPSLQNAKELLEKHGCEVIIKSKAQPRGVQ